MSSTHTEIINVGDWEMTVRIAQLAPDSLYTMHIAQIRNSQRSLPDWTDHDNSYRTPDEARAAALKWAEKQFK
jgi:hypothetical protein